MPPKPLNPVVIDASDSAPNWNEWRSDSGKASPVVKLVIGPSPGSFSAKGIDAALPRDLADLFPNLTHLHLWKVTDLVELPKLPPNLGCLDVRDCLKLSRLPPSLPTALETLDMGRVSGVTEIPAGPLPRLKWVYLDGCTGLTSFSSLRPMVDQLEHLELSGCRFQDLPSFLCGEPQENVAEKVRSHFRALREEWAGALPECKVVVLGNGGVGKTSLVRALKRLPHREGEESTDGIRLWHWDADGFIPFPEASPEKVQLNIWDFGGQDLYHNTHRLFLESRAVFLIVWRAPRRDGKPLRPEHPNDPVRPLKYWIDQAISCHPKARLLLVRMGCDEDKAHPPLDWEREIPPEYHHVPRFKVSAKNRTEYDLVKLRDKLRLEVQAELQGAEAVQLGRGRLAVRQKLREWQPAIPDDDSVPPPSARPILRVHEFTTLVGQVYNARGIPIPNSQETLWLLDYLHHSGAVYCPQAWRDQDRFHQSLAYPIIVDQRWAIEGIYLLVREGPVREKLVSRHGRVTPDYLEKHVWGPLRRDGGAPLYDAVSQWVFIEFLKSCGILVPLGRGDEPFVGEYLIPDLLPNFETLAAVHSSAPFLDKLADSSQWRTYFIRDRALGPGFGSLLVGHLARMFGRVPVYRFGAVGKVRADEEFGLGKAITRHAESIVRVDWHRENNNDYHGDIVVRLPGDESADGAVLNYLWGEFRGIPGFPEKARFETASGTWLEILESQLAKDDGFPIGPIDPIFQKSKKGESMRSVYRYALVGFSVAGNDAQNPQVERLPLALKKRLESKEVRGFDILYYKSDHQRNTVSELIRDLGQGDLMLAFISGKYLRSEYCMAELLACAQHHQPEQTSDKPGDVLNHLWLVPIEPGLRSFFDGRSKRDVAAREKWKEEWFNKATEFWQNLIQKKGGRQAAKREAKLAFPYNEWMSHVEEDSEGTLRILAAISQSRFSVGNSPMPVGADEMELETWAGQQVEKLANLVEEKMHGLVVGLTPEKRRERAKTACLKHWKENRSDQAADAFEELLRLGGKTDTNELAEVREYHCRRQGKNSNPGL